MIETTPSKVLVIVHQLMSGEEEILELPKEGARVEVRLLRSERQDAPGGLTPGAPFLIVDGITAKSRDDYLCVEVPLGGILQAKGLLLKLPPRVRFQAPKGEAVTLYEKKLELPSRHESYLVAI